MSGPRRLAVALAALVVAATAGCGREPAFEDRTARVTVAGRTTTFEVDACTLDGTTAYVVGRSEGGAVLQAVVGVEDDGTTGVPASTGITVASAPGDDPSVAAFGPEAWARRGEDGTPPGTIDEARIRGARIQAAGQAQPVDDEDRPIGAQRLALDLDARCDAPDE